MCMAMADQVRLLHAVPGRVRVHVPSRLGADREWITTQLRAIAGVRTVHFNTLTENMLVRVDPDRMSTWGVLALVQRLVFGAVMQHEELSAPDAITHARAIRPDRGCVVPPEHRAGGAPSGGQGAGSQGASSEAAAGIAHGRLLHLGWVLARLVFGPASPLGRPSTIGMPAMPRPRPIARQFVWAVLWSVAVEVAVQGIGALLRTTLQGNRAALVGLAVWIAQSLGAAILPNLT